MLHWLETTIVLGNTSVAPSSTPLHKQGWHVSMLFASLLSRHHRTLHPSLILLFLYFMYIWYMHIDLLKSRYNYNETSYENPNLFMLKWMCHFSFYFFHTTLIHSFAYEHWFSHIPSYSYALFFLIMVGLIEPIFASTTYLWLSPMLPQTTRALIALCRHLGCYYYHAHHYVAKQKLSMVIFSPSYVVDNTIHHHFLLRRL